MKCTGHMRSTGLVWRMYIDKLCSICCHMEGLRLSIQEPSIIIELPAHPCRLAFAGIICPLQHIYARLA